MEVLNDMWVLDVDKAIWSKVSARFDLNSVRQQERLMYNAVGYMHVVVVQETYMLLQYVQQYCGKLYLHI